MRPALAIGVGANHWRALSRRMARQAWRSGFIERRVKRARIALVGEKYQLNNNIRKIIGIFWQYLARV